MTKAKKTATKKQAKRGVKLTGDRVVGRLNGPVGHQLAQAPAVLPVHEALAAFDAALAKVQDIRAVLLASESDCWEVVANRARRLADAASNLQTAGWTLRESAYHEADK